ncbi:MAG: isoprenylcysteine carboxylmethyltransferase family protein [Verrucomicrobiota bacterium]|nr:isoprenylcysteine carboxylmethyltransferase family protein [Verrucomicrobiota bacterium]
MHLRRLGLVFLNLFLFATVLHSSQINLTVNQNSSGRDVVVTVINESSSPVQLTQVKLEIGSYASTQSVPTAIEARASRDFAFVIDYPATPGSYVQIATISYLNEGSTFSLRAVGRYNFQFERSHQAQAQFQTASIKKQGELVLKAADPDSWTLILPNEIQIANRRVEKDKLICEVVATNNGFNNTYQIYAYQTLEKDGAQSLALVDTRLTADTMASYERGRTPDKWLYGGLAVGALLGLCLIHLRPAKTRFAVALGKYAARLTFLSGGYLLLRHAPELILKLEFSLTWDWAAVIVKYLGVVRSGFASGEIANFFARFIDYYVRFFALICLPYSYFCDSQKTFAEDKYAALLKVLWYPLVWPFKRERGVWNYQSRLGLLTLCVKFFYIPLLSSWVINNTFYQRDLTNSFALSTSADFAEKLYSNLLVITVYLKALFIYVDTSIFCFGYCVESKYLKNEMRSVEFTFLGWFFCLWCYPPFNSFSYSGFDFTLAHAASYAMRHGALIWIGTLLLSGALTWWAWQKRDRTSFALMLLAWIPTVFLTNACTPGSGGVLTGIMAVTALIAVWWRHPEKIRIAALLGFCGIVYIFVTQVPHIPQHLSPQYNKWYGLTGQILVCAGWGAFAWASVSLGFKGSNLTNRGIVSHGPYRFCRHPAYVLHIFIPVVEAVMFGQYFIGLIIGYSVIYFLRAMTEERHLSHDPDYVAYKQKVPYRFIPGII